jgi:hypothetical protein
MKVCSPMTRLMVSVIASILGYVDYTLIDEVTLVIMDEITDDEKGSKFDYASFLYHAIHFQLASFEELKSFRYQSYLFFLVLFSQSKFYEKKGLQFVKKDKAGNELPVTKWSSILTVSKDEDGFLQFSNQFLFNTYDLLMGHDPPRMPVSYQQKLQLHPSLRVGDWFLFKEFTVIRIYGFELEPYQLPIYIPPIQG